VITIPIDDLALDALQEALTDVLARGLSPAETARILATDPAFAAHRAWVRSFEPRLIEAASSLVRVWARRD
jgi:hypothetical protein